MPDTEAWALEQYRRELTRHCGRVLGSGFEAEDAVQETMVRAWQALGRCERPTALRPWLLRIATNVCIDMLRRPQRRARPADTVPETAGAGMRSARDDPAERATSRESIRMAVAAALARLTPGQRAVLILRDVLRWRAREVAELLGTSETAVNSVLRRARARFGDPQPSTDPDELEDDQRAFLSRFTDSFERHDIGALVSLLRADAAAGARFGRPEDVGRPAGGRFPGRRPAGIGTSASPVQQTVTFPEAGVSRQAATRPGQALAT